MKLYETYDIREKKKYWWTQRDKNNNCFEIRQTDFPKKFCLLKNEIEIEYFNNFNEAEARIKELYVS